MKLFSTSSLNIPIMLKIIIKKVEPKIKILLLLVKELNEEVIKDFSVSFIPISFSDDRILINEILGMPNQRQNRFQMEY